LQLAHGHLEYLFLSCLNASIDRFIPARQTPAEDRATERSLYR
jgi:hypothetical protein